MTSIKAYLQALQKTSFSGDIHTDYATRLTLATDNSIYQVIPEGVIFPRTTDDIAIALKLSEQDDFTAVTFTPRGGGTATNGQSLSSGIVIDCSRHMQKILEINLTEKWVRVQPGVILDQLNTYLKTFGYYFPPEISPSNRATLGGMINTDACGNGSKIIGRTSDYVLDLTCVLTTGEVIQTSTFSAPSISLLLQQHQATIAQKFQNTPRTLSGYNLKKAYTSLLNLHYLMCGSEGTLAIVSECKLKIKPIPPYKKLVVIHYRNFFDALQAIDITENVKPQVIEAIDEQLLMLAREDPIYYHLQHFIDPDTLTGAISLVEFVEDDPILLEKKVESLINQIKTHQHKLHHAIGYYITKNNHEIKLLWDLRKKSVGLISKKKVGSRRPIPFIEDTAVSPEVLSDYIFSLKKLLDQHGLSYGMYGHVDAGCVHVRPALDLKNPEDEKLFIELTHATVKLLQKYKGVLWGEHGMGHRAVFAEQFFGTELYEVMRQIKTFFDPKNKLNPGKIVTSLQQPRALVTLEGPLRTTFDKEISSEHQETFENTLACNGNGACFNIASTEAMCPSYQVTRDRIHSPKGRATLIREWLRQLAKGERNHFEKEVYDALNGCLNCKACATSCPLQVNIPDVKSKFLFHYHKRFRRPMRDYLVANVEKISIIQNKIPRLSNWLLSNKFSKWLAKNIFHLVDLPLLQHSSKKLKPLDLAKLNSLSTLEKSKSLILIQDVFTSFYEKNILSQNIQAFEALGFTVYVAPFFKSGKPLHVKGFLPEFKQIVKNNVTYFRHLAETGIAIVGIDPSMTLTYRDEYQKILEEPLRYNVQLPQEYLHDRLSSHPREGGDPFKIDSHLRGNDTKIYYLLMHCTEKTALVAAEDQWKTIFKHFGLTLKVLPAGCCGMAGAYGHEREHLQYSKELFSREWQHYLSDPTLSDNIIATGYSCRSQIKRLTGKDIQHPLSILANIGDTQNVISTSF